MINKEDCYKLLKKIPRGKVSTYKIIANLLGTKSYRAIGKIISQNNDIPNTPCHRVVKSNGHIGGYALGVEKKIIFLNKEGIKIQDDKIVNFSQVIYNF